MKRLFVLMSCALVLSACTTPTPMPVWTPVAKPAPAPQLYDAQGNAIDRIPFRAGVSSVTVEKMAMAQGCTGGQGAGLITPPGPVEMYRMVCESNQIYTAKCEFRQCKPMTSPPPGGYAQRPAPAPVAIPAPHVAAVVATSPVASPTVVPRAAPVAAAKPAVVPMAAPVAVAKPAVVPMAPAAPNGREVPKLSVTWDCGACVKNDNTAMVLVSAYEKEALARGFTVSTTDTATMTIRKYREKSTVAGVAPGRDFINTMTVGAGKTIKITDASSNMSFNMTGLAEKVARETLDRMVAK